MTIDNQTGLVLEGGGMRGVFTAGVLDYFMDNNIRFPYIVGVSAGASNGLSYASWQRGRSKFSNIDLLKKYNYIGFRHLLKGKGIINLDYLFNIYPDKYYPFDYDTFFSSSSRFVIVASNCLTGQAEYFEEKEKPERLLAITRASCSLPVLCPVTYVDGIPMVDGGVTDSIPIKRAIIDGYNRNVVVLTRNKGYRKKDKDFRLPRFIYKEYPLLREQLRLRYKQYNDTLDYIDQLEDEHKITVIRPVKKLQVGRTEKDTTKLIELYNEGYTCASRLL